jgi:uncharacterized protein YndB with AHSA1/START domain
MASQSFSVTRIANAPREKVWALVSTASSWKDWAGVMRSSLDREGDPPPDGVGAIRHLGPPVVGSREQVVEWDPPSHLGYVILNSAVPVKNYRADIRLEETTPSDGSPVTTIIEWSATFDPKVPGTGALVRSALKAMVSRFARRAASYAARPAP